MFEEGISQPARNNLALLAKHKISQNFYLAGGTACALRLGHRLSFDLDFFTKKTFDAIELAKNLEKIGKLGEKQVGKDTLLGSLGGIKISFFKYNYPLIGKTDKFEGTSIASLEDLAAMKIEALAGRGRKRDFIDLYFICQILSIEKILGCYDKKYRLLETNKFHIIKSLAFFGDAQDEPMPEMIKEAPWEDVKEFFEAQVRRLAKSLI